MERKSFIYNNYWIRALFLIVISIFVTNVDCANALEENYFSSVINLTDWGISDVRSVFSGQIAIVENSQENTIEFHSLYPDLLSSQLDRDAANDEEQIDSIKNFPISFLDGKEVNNLDGRFGVYRKLPSSGNLFVNNGEISFSYQKKEEGYCGLWTHLFDSSLSLKERQYFDSSWFAGLSFWIRGLQNIKNCSLRFADRTWSEKDDAVRVGNISDFQLSESIDGQWIHVFVPFELLPSTLNRKQLASFVLSIDAPGEGVLSIRDILFLHSRPTQELPVVTFKKWSEDLSHNKATWIWNTPLLLADANERESIIEFLIQKEIQIVFLQLPKPFFQVDFKPINEGSLLSFTSLVGAIKSKGIQVFALDGSPSYGRPENHDSVLRLLSNVIRYNHEVLSEYRLTGVHFDVEPHALPGFGSIERRQILSDLLSLYEKVKERLRGSQLFFGVDIPFWYDSPDELTGAKNDVLFRGKQKNVCQHIIDLTDYIVVMDYRTKADGADGLIENSAGELRYAESVGKSVFLAVETRPIVDQTLFRIQGAPSQRAPVPFPTQGLFVIRSENDGHKAFLFPSKKSYGAVEKDLDGSNVLYWPIVNRSVVSGAKISFSSLGIQYMDSILTKTASVLTKYSSFKGFAVHDAENYRRLK